MNRRFFITVLGSLAAALGFRKPAALGFSQPVAGDHCWHFVCGKEAMEGGDLALWCPRDLDGKHLHGIESHASRCCHCGKTWAYQASSRAYDGPPRHGHYYQDAKHRLDDTVVDRTPPAPTGPCIPS